MSSRVLACLLSVSFMFALFGLISCGGGGGDGAASGPYTADEVAARMTADLGGEAPALRAFFYAMDKGYSIGQIADAAMNSRITPTGDLLNPDGSVAGPIYPALNEIQRELTRPVPTMDMLIGNARHYGTSLGRQAVSAE